MIATIWGSRGSLATPGAGTVQYGGNTSCVQLDLGDGTRVVLDAGTGIRELGLRLANRPPAPIHLLLTHLHLDHIAGLPFFAPLWDARTEIHLWAPSPRATVEATLTRFMSPPLFPVSMAEAPASVSFHEVPAATWSIGSVDVTAERVRHLVETVGYRLDEGGRSLAHIPDHEPYPAGDLAAVEAEDVSGYRIAAGSSLLVHDAQYLEHEYPARIGWGHASVAHAVSFARAAGTRRLVLFHHDPLHSDRALAALAARAAELWSGASPPVLAREGMRFRVGGNLLDVAAVGNRPRPSVSLANGRSSIPKGRS